MFSCGRNVRPDILSFAPPDSLCLRFFQHSIHHNSLVFVAIGQGFLAEIEDNQTDSDGKAADRSEEDCTLAGRNAQTGKHDWGNDSAQTVQELEDGHGDGDLEWFGDDGDIERDGRVDHSHRDTGYTGAQHHHHKILRVADQQVGQRQQDESGGDRFVFQDAVDAADREAGYEAADRA